MKVILNDPMYNDKEIFSKRPHLQHNFKVPKTHVIPQSMYPALQIPAIIFASIVKCMHFQRVLV